MIILNSAVQSLPLTFAGLLLLYRLYITIWAEMFTAFPVASEQQAHLFFVDITFLRYLFSHLLYCIKLHSQSAIVFVHLNK